MKEVQGFSLEKFVPSWPSSVMGTAIIPVALYLGRKTFSFFYPLALVFTGLTLLVLISVSTLWLLRLFRHPEKFREEIHHPVAGSFLPTLPIAFMIATIDWLLIGANFIPETFLIPVALFLFLAGTAGIYFFSWMIMPVLFQSKNVKAVHGTFGWYIPPVSHLIVPVVALEIIHKSQGEIFPVLLFSLSLISLGIGIFLFIFVGANIFHRYLYQSSPAGKMAPTLFIGLAPTAILTIILVKLFHALPDLPFIAAFPAKGMIQLTGLALWGFSFWWLILSLLKISYALVKQKLSFTLSWWAFTFPVGALAVATGALKSVLSLPFLTVFQVSLSLFLLFLWSVVFFLTIKGILSGDIFEE